MKTPKCFKCEKYTKKVSPATRLFSGKYLLSDVTVFVCPECSEEYYDLDEYGKISKKINAIESTTPQKALAQAKLVVL